MLQFASSKEYRIVTRYTSTHGAGFIACDVRFILGILSLLHTYDICNKAYANKTLGWGKRMKCVRGFVWEYRAGMPRMV